MVYIKFKTASIVIIFMFFAAVSNHSNSAGAVDAVRITNGVNAAPHEFPFMVALHARISVRGRYQHVCGGSLVTKRHVITAAHCYNTTYSYSVVLGAHDNTGRGNPQQIQILKWHRHPEYKSTNAGTSSGNGDIAVIILKEDAKFTRDVSVITLPKTDIDESGRRCTAIGWGRTSENGPKPSVLQKTELEIKSPIECMQHFSSTKTHLHPGYSCAYGFPSGVCHGDSGGPFVCKDPGSGSASTSPFYLFGVASGVEIPCGAVGKYAAFTRVGYSGHLSFITNITSQKVTDGSGRGEVPKIAVGFIVMQCFGFYSGSAQTNV